MEKAIIIEVIKEVVLFWEMTQSCLQLEELVISYSFDPV